MGVFQNNLMGAAAAAASASTDFYDYQITNSLRLNGTSQALERSFSSTPSNADAKALSFWIKRSGASGTNSAFGSTTNTKICSSSTGNGAVADMLEINTNNPTGYSDQFHYYLASGGANYLKAKWRDPSAWIHIVWIYNSDESTTTDRIKVYINGESNTINDSNYWDNDGNNGYPSSGADTSFGLNGNEMHIGRYVYDDAGWWGGQIADFIMIDGAASISDFGETKNGVWKPVDPSGLTFGTNGFWLDFKSASDPGNDASGNNNDFTNIGSIPASATTLDTPTFNSDSNGGNFATYNPIVAQGSAQKLMTLSEGNLHAQSETNDKYHQTIGTMGVKTGKWYIEWYIEAAGYPSWAVGWHYGSQLGLFNGDVQANNANLAYLGYFTGSNVYVKGFSGTGTSTSQVAYSGWTSAGDAPTTGDVMMVCMDFDAGKAWYGFNGEWGDVGSGTGNPATGANASVTWTVADFADYKFPFTLSWANPDAEIVMNCGQDGTFAGNITAGGNSDDTGYGNFKYNPPTGFLALCTGNLPTADAINPSETDNNYPQELFSPLLYTGNGGTNNITGLGFQPDLVWIKIRNTASNGPLVDSNRGTNKILFSQITDAEATSANLTAFGSDGFSLAGGLASYDPNFNGNTNTYCSWNWRANGGTTSTNSTGSHSVTQQVDPSGGFSISTMADTGGAVTIGHGLSKAPSMYIVKGRSGDTSWGVYHEGIGATKYLLMETHSAAATGSQYFNDTAPTSTVLSLGATWNGAGTLVVYAFANIEGYCKAGSYAANGNADGSFVYTGFRPAYVMIKGHDVGAEWTVYDDKRDPFNEADHVLQMDIHDAERTDLDEIDILSNGFKCRDNGGRTNQSGKNYVYLAMAHNPFKYATGR